MFSACLPRRHRRRPSQPPSYSSNESTEPTTFDDKDKIMSSSPHEVDLLILGAGWTSTFLVPLLLDEDDDKKKISFARTTRDGRDGSIEWTFDPSDDDDESNYKVLPSAKTVLITFPIKERGAVTRLVKAYERLYHPSRRQSSSSSSRSIRWIQLGSTGIWDGGPTLVGSKLLAVDDQDEARRGRGGGGGGDPPSYSSSSFTWTDRHSRYDSENPRAIAEDELLSLASNTFVLNLAGLWGGERDPSNWIDRVASSKQQLAVKGSLHLIHGLDVARAIVAVHLAPPVPSSSCSKETSNEEEEDTTTLKGKRYLLTDLRVIDWWDLASRYPSPQDCPRKQFEWVRELMHEHRVRALPRTPLELGRALDSFDFWNDFGLMPIRAGYEKSKL